MELSHTELAEQLFTAARWFMDNNIRIPVGPSHRALYESLSMRFETRDSQVTHDKFEVLVQELTKSAVGSTA